jgi:hypothetical protein
MVSIDEELRAANKAKAVISVLMPSTPPAGSDVAIVVLRSAFRTATNAIRNLSSLQSLDNVRGEVGTALLGLSHALENESLTQETIDRAKRAVEAWLNGLAKI